MITNYDTLVSAVVALAEDDGEEFFNYIPTAIYVAEERLMKELDTDGIQEVVFVTATSGNQFLFKPEGYRVVQDLYFEVSGSVNFPAMKTASFIKDYWPNVTTKDKPKYFGNWDSAAWILAPTPDQNYVFTVNCVQDVPHLTSSVSANYFTSRAPDALLYATMSHMSEFMKDYGTRDTVWEPKYARALEGLNNEARRSRRDSAKSPKNPDTNTLTGNV